MANNPRDILIQAMHDLSKIGHDCTKCVGTCCTFVANSMQIDEREALELKEWLVAQDRWNEQTWQSLQDCIDEYRLDVEIGPLAFRRTYTCPFYTGAKLGCSIAPEAKPYGCLAFNPREAGVTEGGNCRSDQELLKQMDVKVVGQKFPIPVALLKLR